VVGAVVGALVFLIVTYVLPLRQWWCFASISTGLGEAPSADGSTLSMRRAAAKVTTALARIEQGNFSRVKSVGAGVFESTIDFGPGYRIYFGKDGDALVILLAGGTKKRQQRDIALAKERWADYKQQKTKEK
jgi:putative addiction module killer protein